MPLPSAYHSPEHHTLQVIPSTTYADRSQRNSLPTTRTLASASTTSSPWIPAMAALAQRACVSVDISRTAAHSIAV